MDIKRFTNFWVLILVLIVTLTVPLPNVMAQDHTRWSLPDGAKARLGKGYATEIVYSPDGALLAVGSTIGVWLHDAQSGKALSLIAIDMDAINNVSFSPDGKTIATGSGRVIGDRRVHLWDVDTATLKNTLLGHRGPIFSVAFSPDGKTIATGGSGGRVYLRDVDTATLKHTLLGHRGQVSKVSFSPDGKTIATGSRSVSAGGDVRLWDVDTGTPKNTLVGHIGEVFNVSFSPDGKTIATVGSGGTILLWDLAPTTDASLSFSPSQVQSPAIGQTTEPQRFIAPQSRMTPSYLPVGGNNTLSFGGMSVGFHTELGTNAPFIGIFGYHRQPVTFTYTGQLQTVNLGWFGGVEYADASWGESFLGINTKFDAEIFVVTGMVGTDIQSPSGVLTVGTGFALHAMDLGVGVELFGIEARSSGEYNGITPTALIAYTFHTVTGGPQEGAATFYARYQGQGFMVGVSLGIISFD